MIKSFINILMIALIAISALLSIFGALVSIIIGIIILQIIDLVNVDGDNKSNTSGYGNNFAMNAIYSFSLDATGTNENEESNKAGIIRDAILACIAFVVVTLGAIALDASPEKSMTLGVGIALIVFLLSAMLYEDILIDDDTKKVMKVLVVLVSIIAIIIETISLAERSSIGAIIFFTVSLTLIGLGLYFVL